MSRVVSGEVMAATFREWRRRRSTCNGALVWFLRDLWPGAGWGVVGSDGVAKAPFYYLRRALQPRAISLSDEGGNGLFVHIANESTDALAGSVEISLYRDSEFHVATGRQTIVIGGRGTAELPAASCFDGFFDLTYAYRFGPPSHDIVVATLLDSDGGHVTSDVYWPLGLGSLAVRDVGIAAKAKALSDDNMELTVATRSFAHAVTIRAAGWVSEDQYFHLAPGTERKLLLRRSGSDKPPRGTVQALNARSAAKIHIEE
jgi:beta-mannosidase